MIRLAVRAMLLLMVVATASFAGVAILSADVSAAQDATSELPENESYPNAERIDENTILVDYEYHPDRGSASVKIWSERPQEITVLDGSYLMRGTEMQFVEKNVIPREITTITVPAEEVNGYVMLSVGTARTAGYGVPIEVPTDLLPGVPGPGDAPAAGVGVGLAAIVGAGAAWVYYRFWQGGVSHVF